ncbi:hypothetical protein ScPMuIL_000604 [Solemya velum]
MSEVSTTALLTKWTRRKAAKSRFLHRIVGNITIKNDHGHPVSNICKCSWSNPVPAGCSLSLHISQQYPEGRMKENFKQHEENRRMKEM